MCNSLNNVVSNYQQNTTLCCVPLHNKGLNSALSTVKTEFKILPTELQIQIFSFLKWENAQNLPQVCHSWSRICNSEELWEKISEKAMNASTKIDIDWHSSVILRFKWLNNHYQKKIFLMNLSNFFYLKNKLVVLPGREPPNEPIQVMDRDWKTIRIIPSPQGCCDSLYYDGEIAVFGRYKNNFTPVLLESGLSIFLFDLELIFVNSSGCTVKALLLNNLHSPESKLIQIFKDTIILFNNKKYLIYSATNDNKSCIPMDQSLSIKASNYLIYGSQVRFYLKDQLTVYECDSKKHYSIQLPNPLDLRDAIGTKNRIIQLTKNALIGYEFNLEKDGECKCDECWRLEVYGRRIFSSRNESCTFFALEKEKNQFEIYDSLNGQFIGAIDAQDIYSTFDCYDRDHRIFINNQSFQYMNRNANLVICDFKSDPLLREGTSRFTDTFQPIDRPPTPSLEEMRKEIENWLFAS
ncbi:MAG: F-box protein [Parachlamydiaceae bacterium]|nr:F-box protein [Parachlamydiaceae bacterium]